MLSSIPFLTADAPPRSPLSSPAGRVLGGGAVATVVAGLLAAALVSAPAPVVSPAQPRAGSTFAVDASGVSTGLRPPLRYEWDLDHDPTRADGFELDTGATAVAHGRFLTAGDRHVRVRITGADGRSAVVERRVRVAGARNVSRAAAGGRLRPAPRRTS